MIGMLNVEIAFSCMHKRALGLRLLSGAAVFFLPLTLISIAPAIQAVPFQSQSGRNSAKVDNPEFARGLELLKQNQFPEAAKVWKGVVAQNKADAEAWYYLGRALIRQPKEIKNASRAFETALKLQPNFALAHAGLANALMLRDKVNESQSHAERAIAIDARIADAHFIRGLALLRKGNEKAALEEARETIRLEPQSAAPYLLKSQALLSFVLVAPLTREKVERTKRLEWYSEAADALETYLKLANRPESDATWRDQLEALRFYVSQLTKKDADKDVQDAADLVTKARILKKPEPRYTEEARQNKVMGTVVLRAVFSAEGKVNHILVVSGLPNGLTQAAVAAAKQIKFVPAEKNGQPVSMFIQLEYNFHLF